MSTEEPRRERDPDLAFLRGGGEMGARMRELDWSATPLGPPQRWPQSLKTCVRIILTSRQPMFVWWGRELVNLYNDPYKSIVGGKHPQALGQPASDVWREIWDEAGPRAARTMSGDEGTYDEALLLIMERYGYQEETYYTFSYSPVPDDAGGVAGIICANTDDTQRIVGERRVALLRDLATRTADARTIADACAACAHSLEVADRDLPFALLYLLDMDARRVQLAGCAGIQAGHTAAPRTASLDKDAPWPFEDVARTHELRVVEDLGALGPLPTGAWPKAPTRAVVTYIAPSGATGCAAILVAGLSPYRLFDEDFRGFVGLVAGQISASIANAQAYEEEKRRAEKLAEIDRAKTTFFSNVSHEFRTPLTLMLGPTEDALARDPAALTGEDLAAVHRNGLRLLKLVNALLDFSRMEAGRAQAAYTPIDLAGLTRDLSSAFRAAIERASLDFVVDCAPLAERVFVDRDMWEKIVLNLLSNALKFTFEGSITVKLIGFARHVELSVADTGIGIPGDELPRLFHRFHRVQGARSRTHEGSGIGLALVNELVKLHGGWIGVESSVGRGTRFTLVVPLGSAHLPAERVRTAPMDGKDSHATTTARAYVEEALRWLPGADELDEPPSPESHPPATAPPSGAHRIAVVDDNADMRDYVARLLGERWTVERYADGVAALEAIERRPPDLVLTDVMMPRLDGFGLLRALRSRPETRNIPIIMLSARAGEEARVDGLEAGADDYLVKPFSARELLARVATHLQLAALRAAAEAASRAKDEFLSTLSHELRTPLNAIVGWASLLRGGNVPGERVSHAVETIERNARIQARLIEDLLDLSRIEQGKLVLSVGPVEMVRIVEAALDAVRPASEAKGVVLQSVLDSEATIVGDPDRLQQVVWNLVSNAIKFTPKGGRVQVTLRREPSFVEVAVSDNGQGIEPGFLPYVFERFRQGDPSLVRKSGGLGLGLAIVRSLVELHGGTVSARSEGTGRGAEFVVRIPTAPVRRVSEPHATPNPRAHAKPTFDCPPRLEGIRVLVVDDEPQTRELLKFVLEQCKVEVLTAGSASEAIEMLQREKPDLLISDVGMPGEDGHSLVRRLRALSPADGGGIPAVALTAYARGEDRTQALRAGFDMHMAKPIDPAELVVIVDTLLARHKGTLRASYM